MVGPVLVATLRLTFSLSLGLSLECGESDQL